MTEEFHKDTEALKLNKNENPPQEPLKVAAEESEFFQVWLKLARGGRAQRPKPRFCSRVSVFRGDFISFAARSSDAHSTPRAQSVANLCSENSFSGGRCFCFMNARNGRSTSPLRTSSLNFL